jgi:dTDP-L-rhamnose 4-epimerase
MKILVTGGAGFIGSRLVHKLHAEGATLTVFDSLIPQVHGADADFPPALRAAASCIRGDIRDQEALAAAVAGQEAIVHFAAETGTGQSMYAAARYADTNIGGTARLCDILVNARPPALRKIVVASSRAVYGEGLYACGAHGRVYPAARTAEAMRAGRFEPQCPICGDEASVLPTPEDAPFAPSSFYGLTKQVQEQMVLLYGRALGLDAFALRYQNVFGPGQSLSNAYTGILAVFTNLARTRAPILIFEDGAESRDFVYVDDVVAATALCLRPDSNGVEALNIGSGARTSVLEVARAILAHFGDSSDIRITGDFRLGDIRHNLADLSRARQVLGYKPQWSFTDGLRRFLAWAESQAPVDTGYEKSLRELRDRGLLGGGGNA